ncbi:MULTISPECIES: type II toxin-antitoxin system RelE/ParE family toxin, partial [Spirulina sp. CCY15215]|uniref:type II toxin-antitoxin system RelE/ParE family toxin n=1 Tax=Spirulina sp. CCY15215 TaxID=2767591 RepID=UPI0019505EB0
KIAWQLQHSFGNTRTFVKKCDRGHSNCPLRSPIISRNTYRTIYTVRLAGTVYVLHAFQKK